MLWVVRGLPQSSFATWLRTTADSMSFLVLLLRHVQPQISRQLRWDGSTELPAGVNLMLLGYYFGANSRCSASDACLTLGLPQSRRWTKRRETLLVLLSGRDTKVFSHWGACIPTSNNRYTAE